MAAINHFDPSVLFYILVAVQIVGLSSAWLTRCNWGCRGHRQCQWIFLICLPLMGVGTIVSIGVSAAFWLLSAATLAVMILAAIWDVGGASGTEAV